MKEEHLVGAEEEEVEGIIFKRKKKYNRLIRVKDKEK
jgi:hypothetical protein